MTRCMARFARNEAGGATVEWVIITGFAVTIGMVVIMGIVGGTQHAASVIEADMARGTAVAGATSAPPTTPMPTPPSPIPPTPRSRAAGPAPARRMPRPVPPIHRLGGRRRVVRRWQFVGWWRIVGRRLLRWWWWWRRRLWRFRRLWRLRQRHHRPDDAGVLALRPERWLGRLGILWQFRVFRQFGVARRHRRRWIRQRAPGRTAEAGHREAPDRRPQTRPV